ncbi:MAG: hypothetical protein ACTHON_13570 [Humibacter sp.]
MSSEPGRSAAAEKLFVVADFPEFADTEGTAKDRALPDRAVRGEAHRVLSSDEVDELLGQPEDRE